MTSPSAAGSGGSLFTVVLFSGTHAAGSGRALASALGQTVTGSVIVAIGDGVAPGRVEGAEPSEGPPPRYLAFLDTDDVWLPHRLDLALAGLARAPVTWCAGRRADEVPHGARDAVPRSASAIAIDRSVLVEDGSLLDDLDALRRVFTRTEDVWAGWSGAHAVAAVDEVGVLTGYR